MLQTQLRYIQTVLTFGIFITIFLNNENLIISCFVGLILAWQLELLACELRTTSNEFILILLLLITSFSPVATIFFEISEIKNMIFLISILIGIFYLTFLFLILFFVKTLATFFNIQFSNYQYFFNFFASFFVVSTVSLFSGFTIQYVLIAAGLISIFTVIMNFLFQRKRREYKYFSTLTTQIYLFDYLVSFLFALYFVDVLNLINGLF